MTAGRTYGLLLLILLTLAVALAPSVAGARPEYAATTAQGCTVCHTAPEGGALSATGLDFAASGLVWPPTKSGYRVLAPMKRPVRLAVGYLHMLAAFMWFGTILYVHIMLRPGYASKGLPRGEVILGLASMTVVGASGVLLTISRINDASVLFGTRWGLLLSLKIALYLFMVSSAVAVVSVVGPRLRRRRTSMELPKDGVFDPTTLAAFDGKGGRRALVAYKGRVYDVSSSGMWKEGAHMRLHAAGGDLTAAIARAPHGPEKIEAMDCVGDFDMTKRPDKTPAQKAFYVIAYMNLGLVFCVLLVIALWRWGG